MKDDFIQGTGALESHYDARTVTHETTTAVPLVTGGYDYGPTEIEHQHKVGICTAISLVQNAEKYFGKKFSPDFQYLLQKKYFDLAWYEGSSIFNALKVGKNYGFLPIELFTWITEDDRNLSYADYAAKLEAIPDAEVQRLILLCTNKLTGYGQVDVSNPQSVAKSIVDSKTGILCRYTSGSTWWTAVNGQNSWATKDIDPLRRPTDQLSGHAIIASKFDYTVNMTQTLANTWGILWNDQNKGNAHIDWNNYKMDEAWIPYYDFVPTIQTFTHTFNVDMKIGQTSDEITALQKALSTLGYFKVQPTGYYGPITVTAVFAFQQANINLSWYERWFLRGTQVGIKTRSALNDIFSA